MGRKLMKDQIAASWNRKGIENAKVFLPKTWGQKRSPWRFFPTYFLWDSGKNNNFYGYNKYSFF